MKHFAYIFTLSLLASLASAQSTQKQAFQEVRSDTNRANHRGPMWGFWYGSGDTTFFLSKKDTFIIAVGGIPKYRQDAQSAKFQTPFWFGPNAGAIQHGRINFMWHLSGEPDMYDSLRLIAGKGVSATQSGHAITFAALPSYKTSPADKPPNTPNGFNDEYDSATLDTTSASPTGWAWINRHANVHATAQYGTCFMIDTGQATSNGWRILAKTVGDSAWTMTAKITGAPSGSFTNCGLILYNGTNGRVVFAGSNSNNITTHWIQVNKYTDLSTYSTSPFSSAAPWPTTTYFRVSKSASNNFTADYSGDGLKWTQIWNEAGSTFIEQTSGKVNKIGIGVFASANNIIAQCTFWWFRVNWTPDFNSVTDN